jgi:hypothetical protein
LETNKEINAGPSNTEQNNTADNFTSIINNVIQELCTLDDMYESMPETNWVINAGLSDIENSNNMTDRFIDITNNNIQEL